MYLYVPFRERCFLEDVGEYRASGIKAVHLFPIKKVKRIGDISTDGKFVRSIALWCTLTQLKPAGLEDEILRFLG